jgi:hypothetical protein
MRTQGYRREKWGRIFSILAAALLMVACGTLDSEDESLPSPREISGNAQGVSLTCSHPMRSAGASTNSLGVHRWNWCSDQGKTWVEGVDGRSSPILYWVAFEAGARAPTGDPSAPPMNGAWEYHERRWPLYRDEWFRISNSGEALFPETSGVGFSRLYVGFIEALRSFTKDVPCSDVVFIEQLEISEEDKFDLGMCPGVLAGIVGIVVAPLGAAVSFNALVFFGDIVMGVTGAAAFATFSFFDAFLALEEVPQRCIKGLQDAAPRLIAKRASTSRSLCEATEP